MFTRLLYYGLAHLHLPQEEVWLMFDNFVGGVPIQDTVRQLKTMGVKTLRGCDFTRFQITYILQNERYCGDMLLQKSFAPAAGREKPNEGELPLYYVQDCHEAVIDRSIFQWVQEEIKRRRAEGPTAQPGMKTYCFTGKIICGECGNTYHRGTRYCKALPPSAYWVCRTKKTKGLSCSSKNLPDKALKKAVAKALGLPAFDEAVFKEMVDKIVTAAPRDIIICFRDGREVREPVIMEGHQKSYPPEVTTYRAEQRRLKKEMNVECQGQ